MVKVLAYRVVVNTCNLSPWETRGSEIQSQPGLHESLSREGEKKNKEPVASILKRWILVGGGEQVA